MKGTITLSKKERKSVKSHLERLSSAKYGFREASEFLREAEENLQQELTKICPGATMLSHPNDEDWEITFDEDTPKLTIASKKEKQNEV
uniref:Uncharacterized protein n=1 Tax=viral metagenome TaxID=1070528 RepID=A0A6H1ZMR1_9ZZZZ